MKRILTLVLCWLISFEAFAISGTNFNFNVGKTLKVSDGIISSLNKFDGTFESGVSGFTASSGTFVQDTSDFVEGKTSGLWTITGTGTLSFSASVTQTASLTQVASMWAKTATPTDWEICGLDGTGCKALDDVNWKPLEARGNPTGSDWGAVLKHIGTGYGQLRLDNAEVKPWTPTSGNYVVQESVAYTGWTSGTTGGFKFTTKETSLSDNSRVIADDNATYAYTRFTFLMNAKGVATLNWNSNATTTTFYIDHYNSAGTLRKSYSAGRASAINQNIPYAFMANAGDYFVVRSSGDNGATPTHFSIIATAISPSIIETWAQPNDIGELKYLLNPTAPQGFIPAQGSILANTATGSATHIGNAYYPLYEHLWTYSATTTAGNPYVISNAKGASASADWAAGKTIKIDVSGLFTRASGGNAGIVGTKQSDAFQGHYHKHNTVSSVALSNLNGTYMQARDVNNGLATYSDGQIGDPVTDGPNGTPRTASETRPVNESRYAFIRYAVSTPTLVSLPVSKENRFESRISSTGTIVSQNLDFINSISLDGSSQYTINYSKLGLSSAPSITTTVDNASTIIARIVSVSATQAVIQTVNATTSAVANAPFTFKLAKQSPDYTAPGGFVSNLNPDGFNKTAGTTGLIDTFSFSYGTTNATTVCSASPCSYLDQIGNYVTSVIRNSAGSYSPQFTKTYAKLKCSINVYTSAGSPKPAGAVSCSNCSSIQIDSVGSSFSAADSYGTIICQGQ